MDWNGEMDNEIWTINVCPVARLGSPPEVFTSNASVSVMSA